MSTSNKVRYVTYGKKYDKEQEFRSRSERLIFITIGLSIIQILFALFNDQINFPYSNILLNGIIIVIFLVAASSTIYEILAERKSLIADYGRRTHFYLDLFRDDFRTDEQQNLRNVGFDIVPEMFESAYANNEIGVTNETTKLKVKIFRFYTILYKVIMSRDKYKKRLYTKTASIWTPLIILTIVALGLNIGELSKFTFSLITIVALSPIFLNSLLISVMWQSKTDQIGKIQQRLLEDINEHELHYLFLEYSLLLQRVIKIPNYKEMEQEIIDGFNEHIILHRDKFENQDIFLLPESGEAE